MGGAKVGGPGAFSNSDAGVGIETWCVVYRGDGDGKGGRRSFRGPGGFGTIIIEYCKGEGRGGFFRAVLLNTDPVVVNDILLGEGVVDGSIGTVEL